ncbi:TetR/AcrR family transcriptional regulator [Neorhizobium sp. P12A]|uniref:TetR/AcrR family transcriptional regulator n=1 Tax=Rhizobium/Agrobacterium group TaxID=227290 RepID=UPI001047E3EF|nr:MULTISPECIES: TetR/AcrR family transcriptional regulator [Rhizobium/Agrobacterium group]KAA0695481.1 TetR/AcrR family transcriptional regulator [Neorhizobium sp. P12A]TCR79028.1 TetR family transcriptional regulator [Rhizobium sp. BK376]
MVEIQIIEKRSRGRPQLRCDDDTRAVILEAAKAQFLENGYAAANISAIAQAAGVSTKTLYRLFPAKTDLFSSIISSKIGEFLLCLDDSVLAAMELEEGLRRILTSYGVLTLSQETIGITRLVLGESDRFQEIANTFYETAIVGTNAIMEKWLMAQCDKGLIKLEDPRTATGMLRGMMIMEPQRATMLGQQESPTRDEIRARAKICARLFLGGCRA